MCPIVIRQLAMLVVRWAPAGPDYLRYRTVTMAYGYPIASLRLHISIY